jgi:hypothetical protein
MDGQQSRARELEVLELSPGSWRTCGCSRSTSSAYSSSTTPTPAGLTWSASRSRELWAGVSFGVPRSLILPRGRADCLYHVVSAAFA